MTMAALTILRTGVGSLPSISTLKSLQKEGVKVVGVDADKYAVGFYFCHASYQVPMADDPQYIPMLLEICEQERVDAVLAAVDEELVVLSKQRHRFEERGILIVAPSLEVVEICFDKWLTYQFFIQHDIPTPETQDALELDLDMISFPALIKPRYGRGSRGIYKVDSIEELIFFRQRVKSPLLQTYLCGQEYTIDLLADLDGSIITVVPRQRLSTVAGISNKGRTVYHQGMISQAQKIAKRLNLTGPSNMQCFLQPSGQIKFTEINPRLAGSVALSEAAGARIIPNLVKLIKGEKVEENSQFEEGVLMLRFWEERFIK